MKDIVIDNGDHGIPTLATEEQWSLRGEQFDRMSRAGYNNAKDALGIDPGYWHGGDHHGMRITLGREMERCFCSGCWISVICIGMASVEAFSNEIWGHGKVRKELEEIEFPHIDWWDSLRKKRNSIMHVNSNSTYHEESNYDLHYYAKMTVWFSYFFMDYICLWREKIRIIYQACNN